MWWHFVVSKGEFKQAFKLSGFWNTFDWTPRFVDGNRKDAERRRKKKTWETKKKIKRTMEDMGVSKNSGTPKWMVYNGKPYKNGWFGGSTIFGNIHMSWSHLITSCSIDTVTPQLFMDQVFFLASFPARQRGCRAYLSSPDDCDQQTGAVIAIVVIIIIINNNITKSY